MCESVWCLRRVRFSLNLFPHTQKKLSDLSETIRSEDEEKDDEEEEEKEEEEEGAVGLATSMQCSTLLDDSGLMEDTQTLPAPPISGEAPPPLLDLDRKQEVTEGRGRKGGGPL
ncbi:uncharacterized protein V6R79_020629 [Siganus canaliculatus]